MGRKSPLFVFLMLVGLAAYNLVKIRGNHFIPPIMGNEKKTLPLQRDGMKLSSDILGRDDRSVSPEISAVTSAPAPTPAPTKSKTVAPPPYIQVTHVPGQRRRTSSLSNTSRPDSISLVVGFWAQPGSFVTASTIGSNTTSSFNQSSYKRPHPHRAEIEAAMINNLHNPYIHQLVVVLDSISDEANCTHHFIPHMQRLSSLVQSKHPQYFDGGSNQQLLQLPCTLTCIDRVEAQPTYLEMFQYSSSSEFVEGPVVIMANTDQAFDTSLKYAAHLQPGAISVISTAGFDRKVVPSSLQAQYKTIMMNHHEQQQEQNRQGRVGAGNTKMKSPPPSPPKMWVKTINRCQQVTKYGSSASWDGYLFEREMVGRALLKEEEQLDPTIFVRGNQHTPYYMNEKSAENAAIYDLTKAILAVMAPLSSSSSSSPPPSSSSSSSSSSSKPILHVWNSCFLIQSWDFHLEAKMHKKREIKTTNETTASGSSPPWDRVPGPAGPQPKTCAGASSMAKIVFDPMFLAVQERNHELPVLPVDCPPAGTTNLITTTSSSTNTQQKQQQTPALPPPGGIKETRW